MVKQLLKLRDELVVRKWSVEEARICLENWFGRDRGLGISYDFFVHKVGRWPWKPISWKSCILPKHRFALWLFAHGKFLTRDRQSYVENKLFVLCTISGENADHLFFKCRVSMNIWEGIREWLDMRKNMCSPNSVLKAFHGVYRGGSGMANMRTIALAACVYHIWNARNRALYEEENPDINGIILKIKILSLRCSPSNIGHDFI